MSCSYKSFSAFTFLLFCYFSPTSFVIIFRRSTDDEISFTHQTLMQPSPTVAVLQLACRRLRCISSAAWFRPGSDVAQLSEPSNRFCSRPPSFTLALESDLDERSAETLAQTDPPLRRGGCQKMSCNFSFRRRRKQKVDDGVEAHFSVGRSKSETSKPKDKLMARAAMVVYLCE